MHRVAVHIAEFVGGEDRRAILGEDDACGLFRDLAVDDRHSAVSNSRSGHARYIGHLQGGGGKERRCIPFTEQLQARKLANAEFFLVCDADYMILHLVYRCADDGGAAAAGCSGGGESRAINFGLGRCEDIS
jgi:hypothetical protein